MAGYTLKASDDIKQVSGSAITATSTVVDGGTSIALGTSVPTGPITAQLQLGGRSEVHGSQVVKSKDVFGSFQGAGVAATSVTNVTVSGYSTDRCKFTKNSHGLAVGDVISVSGSTGGVINGVHVIIAKDANTFTTNFKYTAAATAGNYAVVAGTFATLTAGNYIMRGYAQSVAGGQYTFTGYGADHGVRRSIHKLEAMRTTRTATAIRAGYWNIVTGKWTTAPTYANDISSFGTDHAATPTRAIPGELTYRVSGQPDGTNGVIQDDYPAKTS